LAENKLTWTGFEAKIAKGTGQFLRPKNLFLKLAAVFWPIFAKREYYEILIN
jgi:hypothetical protein